MNWFITILLMFASAIFGLLAAAFCFACGKSDDRILKIQEIDETTEEIIEAAIDHALVVSARTEGDYDINVDKIGTQKIRKILEGLL